MVLEKCSFMLPSKCETRFWDEKMQSREEENASFSYTCDAYKCSSIKESFKYFCRKKFSFGSHFSMEHLWKVNSIIVRHEMCIIIKHKNHINASSWNEQKFCNDKKLYWNINVANGNSLPYSKKRHIEQRFPLVCQRIVLTTCGANCLLTC